MNRIKRYILALTVALAFVGIPCVHVLAAEEGVPLVVDGAEMLSSTEVGALASRLGEISRRQSCDVAVVTTMSTGGKGMMAYADDYFDNNGYGIGSARSGILLLVKMGKDGHGEYWMSTRGYGITAFTDAGISYIGEEVARKLKEREYAGAFDVFAENCDLFLTRARNGKPYDTGNMPKGAFLTPDTVMIAVAVGFALALIAVLAMKGQLKSVRFQAAASDYMKRNSLNVTESKDIYLYSTVSRHARPKSNSSSGGGSRTHTSSSGARHGGGGGKF